MYIPWLTRNIAAGSMLTGAVALAVGNILPLVNHPADDSFAAMLAMVSSSPSLWLFAAILAIAGPILWLPGILATAQSAQDRGRRLTSIGSILMAVGLVIGVGHFALYFGVLGSAVSGGLPLDAAQKMTTAEDSYIVGSVLLWAFLVGLTVGVLLLTLGMRMSQSVPIWVPVAALVFVLSTFLGGPVATLVGVAALLLTFGSIAIALLRTTPAGATATEARMLESKRPVSP
ncbi:hypothetical protein CLV47_11457 [Antricoccus suffuscus]|uniref:DUF4386 family protein n=1 Tax=Antricoccus suffuscus TaxID=1629062 RepID=A0A2T0ZWN6_9ACTN|nr:hypothetical protein [Antricoccus suffuscus]PRZ40760.1 hypothetical protein CLV47_11457 [Antricoccus suffuscus]